MGEGKRLGARERIRSLKKGGRLVVLGAGESGLGAAILASKNGFEVLVSDNGKIAEANKEVLEQIGVRWEEGGHKAALGMKPGLCVKSPGIPDDVPVVTALQEAGVPVISEIEFASWYCEVPIVAITGSNGKTTTALLTHHLLVEGGMNAGLAGNIGSSFARMLTEATHELYVLEVSSFQLDGILGFHPHIAVLTNITPDHLDRYEYKMERYIAAKMRIGMNQTEGDHLVYDTDDPVLSKQVPKEAFEARLWPCTLEGSPAAGAFIEEENIVIRTDKSEMNMRTESLALHGKHNIKNTMAAATVARLLGIRKASIRESVANFQGAPHRLEKVLKIQHVQYINDSKATNVNATYYALDSVRTPVVWIVGGVDKGNDYAALMPLVREKVKAIICLGADNSTIVEAFGNAVELLVETYAMTEAVKVAYKIADRGDTVLLSPACASFDLFENYEDRGNQFKEAVRSL